MTAAPAEAFVVGLRELLQAVFAPPSRVAATGFEATASSARGLDAVFALPAALIAVSAIAIYLFGNGPRGGGE